MMNKTIIFCATLLLVGCANQPSLYPNNYLLKVGKVQSESDIKSCDALADQYMAKNGFSNVVSDGAAGALVGAAFGAAVGAFSGNTGNGAVRGAAVFGATSAATSAVKPDRIREKFITQCLQDKGYQVVGWN